MTENVTGTITNVMRCRRMRI